MYLTQAAITTAAAAAVPTAGPNVAAAPSRTVWNVRSTEWVTFLYHFFGMGSDSATLVHMNLMLSNNPEYRSEPKQFDVPATGARLGPKTTKHLRLSLLSEIARIQAIYSPKQTAAIYGTLERIYTFIWNVQMFCACVCFWNNI